MKNILGLLVVLGLLPTGNGLAVAAKTLDTAFFVGDEGNHRVALYNRDLDLVWEYPVPKPYTVQWLSNGNILTTTGRGVIEITPEKEKVWSFSRDNHEIFGAARIGDLTLVGDCSAGEVLFVGADGVLQKSFKTTAQKKGHLHMRTLTVTPTQTILVAHLGDQLVREYDQAGVALKDFPVRSQAYRGERLANGNTLVGHEKGLTEFDPAGHVIRDIKPQDIPSMGLAFGTHAHRLPNGHTVMANWFGHGGKGGKALFELDRDMNPIWTMPQGKLGSTVAFVPVSDNVVHEFRSAAKLDPNTVLDHELLFVTRRQYKKDHHNTATLFQSGEINETSYDPPGKIKILNLKTGRVKTLVDAGPAGIARDPELSPDGTRIVFCMRKSAQDDYHIYEINVDGTNQKQLTSLPGVSDIDPVYLPDGKIIFSSTREPKFCMCNRHIMANLYRMDGDGANIHQIGKSTLFEGHSTVMEDGRILYDRWEYVDRNFGDAQGLWTVNPDGTMHAIYYGNNTPSPGGVIDARPIPGTQKVVAIFGSCHDRPWGALVVLDRNKGVDGAKAVEHIWPASARNLIGKGNWDTFKKVRPRYEDPYPLVDSKGTAGTYFLCARTENNNDEQTGIYLIDTLGNETLLYKDPDGFGCFDPMPITARKAPPAKPDHRNFENLHGTFYIQNVYEGTHMEGVQPGDVKYLRVVESPEKRSWTPSAWGGQGAQAPAMNWHSFESKRILGTVPVEEDGSAYFTVPSDTYIYFQLLDAEGKMVQSMRSGSQLQSGEMQGCVGCHENRVKTPPPSPRGLLALNRAPSQMGQGLSAGKTFSYLRDVQPIFDKHCIRCHDFAKPAGKKLILAGDKETVFNASYVDLQRKKLITVAGGGPAATYPAKSWGSHASPLTGFLNEHHDTKLTAKEKAIIYTWIDLNGIYYPTYASAYPDHPTGRSPLTTQQLNQLGKLCGFNPKEGLRWKVHPGARISFDRPEKSPCLQSLDPDSDAYLQALAIIRQGSEKLKTTPRADMSGFVPCETDQQRFERYNEFEAIQESYRNALRNGTRLYDTDLQTQTK